jgi:mono/diheme cytochrome c family protein
MNVRFRAGAPRAAAPWMLLFVGLAVAAPPARAEDPPPPKGAAVRPAAQSTEAGKPLPGRCARCHDADGTGRSARDNLHEIPDFSNQKWQASRSDAELLVSILDGKGRHMPGFRGKVADGEARALVASVRALDPAPAAARPVSASQEDFERRLRELQKELDDLKKQFKDASAPRRKP